MIEAVQARQGRRDQLAIRVGERFVLVQADEVIHASLVDEAIVVVTNTVSGTSNYRTLDELQARLDPAVFWRVHRSHLVNITKIKEIVPWFSRNYLLKMKDPKATEIPVSRSQTQAASGVSPTLTTAHPSDGGWSQQAWSADAGYSFKPAVFTPAVFTPASPPSGSVSATTDAPMPHPLPAPPVPRTRPRRWRASAKNCSRGSRRWCPRRSTPR